MRIGTIFAIAIAAVIAVLGVYMTDIEQMQDANLPVVSVNAGVFSDFEAEAESAETNEDAKITLGGTSALPANRDFASN